jgi:hypothetical protein
MKIAVVGSRSFNSTQENLKIVEDFILSKIKISDIEEVISGGAKGADTLAEMFAASNNLRIKIFPANWLKYGKSAGFIRNKEIIAAADIVFAFWDECSKGTKNDIELAKQQNKTLYIHTTSHLQALTNLLIIFKGIK